MNAVKAAEPRVCAQLTSRGTLRNRNHFVPRTAAVRSSIQSSGARMAFSTSRSRFDFFATSGRSGDDGARWPAKTEQAKDAGSARTGEVRGRLRTPACDGLQAAGGCQLLPERPLLARHLAGN